MRSERKWRLNYIQANSECSEDNELVQLRYDLSRYREICRSTQQASQTQRIVNEQMKVTIDELTGYNNQMIMKFKDMSRDWKESNNITELLQDLEKRVHFEQTKYNHLEIMHVELQKELQINREQLDIQQRESEKLKEEINYLEGMKISIAQYQQLKAKVDELQFMNSQLNGQLKIQCNRIQQFNQKSLQEERRKYLDNYEQFMMEKKQIKKQLQTAENLNAQLQSQLKNIQLRHADILSNRLTVPHNSASDRWKETPKGSQTSDQVKQLAAAKVKIQRLEVALENSDRRIAQLECQICPIKKTFTSSEIKSVFCPKPKINIKSPAPKLKRILDGMHTRLHSTGSLFVEQDKTQSKTVLSRNESHIAYFSVGPNDNTDSIINENNPNIANITMLESVQLKHSETETNLAPKHQYQPLPTQLHNNTLTTYSSFTDREVRRKPFPSSKNDAKWINFIR